MTGEEAARYDERCRLLWHKGFHADAVIEVARAQDWPTLRNMEALEPHQIEAFNVSYRNIADE